MRGEHFWEIPLINFDVGSSPHARGTPGVAERTPPPTGIIPACAGNTQGSPVPLSARRDHPRMRGEHDGLTEVDYKDAGSSPHARGTRRRRSSSRFGFGIIPACAGNTTVKAGTWCVPRDHPRMRGEHSMPDPSERKKSGSSPHARGTHLMNWHYIPKHSSFR